MIVNGASLLAAAPIKNMLTGKERAHGVSHGLAEAGYDIRLKQTITFVPRARGQITIVDNGSVTSKLGYFTIASAMEEFQMPDDLVGVVHDKSTWARQGLSVFNTVLEPGWKGFLTLELAFRGNEPVHIPAGAGIAQILFSRIENPASYGGKYQHQADRPVEAISS